MSLKLGETALYFVKRTCTQVCSQNRLHEASAIFILLKNDYKDGGSLDRLPSLSDRQVLKGISPVLQANSRLYKMYKIITIYIYGGFLFYNVNILSAKCKFRAQARDHQFTK